MSEEDLVLAKLTESMTATSRSLHVKVYSPYKTYYDEDAKSISAVNDTGPFDVLAGHHNFITLLNASDLVIRANSGEQRIRISKGLMHVKSDQVIVFLDI